MYTRLIQNKLQCNVKSQDRTCEKNQLIVGFRSLLTFRQRYGKYSISSMLSYNKLCYLERKTRLDDVWETSLINIQRVSEKHIFTSLLRGYSHLLIKNE